MVDKVAATFSVSVGLGGANTSISAEVDARSAEDGGYNARAYNKTSGFAPGDGIYFLVYTGPNYRVKKAVSSAGTVEKQGGLPTVMTMPAEQLTYADGRASTATLGKQTTAIKTQKWFGNAVGTLTLDTDGVTVLPPPMPAVSLTQSQAAIDAAREPYLKPGIAEVTYDTVVEVWKLYTPSRSDVAAAIAPKRTGDYPIHVAIECEAV